MILTQVMRFSSYLLAALAIYYGCVYESPDKTALSLLIHGAISNILLLVRTTIDLTPLVFTSSDSKAMFSDKIAER